MVSPGGICLLPPSECLIDFPVLLIGFAAAANWFVQAMNRLRVGRGAGWLVWKK